MTDFSYLIKNFFVHKDFLVSDKIIPGTFGTPLLFIFESIVIFLAVGSALYISKRKDKVKPVLFYVWAVFCVWEVVIVLWDSFASLDKSFDFATNLSLYPCSIYLYAMPLVFRGGKKAQKMAYGYISTLGLLGAVTAFIYPARLIDYSCISFAGFHTLFYHGAMLFTFLAVMLSHMHSYRGISRWQDLFYASVPGLLLSIPANIINYSHINSDYMYFTGQFTLISQRFPNISKPKFTLIIYALYIIVPSLFYLPSYLCNLLSHFKIRYEENKILAENMG